MLASSAPPRVRGNLWAPLGECFITQIDTCQTKAGGLTDVVMVYVVMVGCNVVRKKRRGVVRGGVTCNKVTKRGCPPRPFPHPLCFVFVVLFLSLAFLCFA